MIALACISQSQGFINALSSTVGLILVNGTAFVTIAILAATKRLKALRYICEWFVFCSQILFAYGSDTSPGFASVAKCAAQMFGMSFMYLFICFDDDFKLASSPVIVLSVFVSISGVFFLHTYVPYESALSIYAAIMYALGWSAYIIHEGYKKVLVRKV
ncbi:hypothetical protein GGI09_000892 [Coemansia sp. S100]|nr:hypothetical protein LPJ71_001029 [Coemansia sp. S17]KAJ2103001.1 hypothetical protein GGI09_000892 [Coemansia sp. S100]KAJ2105615.1 hypothetical protein GGI16_002280 [Coemansia sp. S142-1]